ncbi:MAG: bifunctional diaminohydroxyphosphoribosylaminopyrimidine deaminase/5-amino-6-(5-phosphoribosylamino)uracil reductase RibD [Bacteroidaceae bacterium]|nr:bifunctional diaminohydroxyphosphoribosylaminopyrimidine deaminase/5-amino-6-(5-phosphoribosylamino)uracil reductase RibD [Bacteroidaceae bacterium]
MSEKYDCSAVTPEDKLYISRCLQLARNAAGTTSPNPMVGAVIVCDGKIIGEGYHIRCGEPHAEVNAVASVKDRSLLSQSTIYVSLEPCSHYGKTPPCADMIIAAGIPRVVIATTDNNEMVSGRGIERMRAAGIDVKVGVLCDEAYALNSAFFTYHGKGRPLVTLKWAQSADGFIDVVRDGGKAQMISNLASLMAVHKLRATHDAILVGPRTALLDNPSLTLRHWPGKTPLRLVIDRDGVLPTDLHLFDGLHPTIVYTSALHDGRFGANVSEVVLDFSGDVLQQILEHLHAIKVGSLLVEGGASLLQSFIDGDLWDCMRVETNGALRLGAGVAAPVVPKTVKSISFTSFGNEITTYLR